MRGQIPAILWAQVRILRNLYPRRGLGGLAFTLLVSVLWYGMWLLAALGVFAFCADPSSRELLDKVLPVGLAGVFLYWQIMPIATAGAGASVDARRLLVYPVRAAQLFFLEVLLRLPLSVEPVLVLVGAAAGLASNPAVSSHAAPLGLLLFGVFNLLLSAALKVLIDWIARRKRLKEALILLIVLSFALPQVLLARHEAGGLNWDRILPVISLVWWPWGAAARISLGGAALTAWVVLPAWIVLAWRFGRRTYERSLVAGQGETAARQSAEARVGAGVALLERFLRWPAALFKDPLASLAEKEIRSLIRTPRFRLVFIMGFTFGLMVWGPLAFLMPGTRDSAVAHNFLAFVSLYALLLMGEVAFWNSFGFDRSAVQTYFVAPVRLSTVLLAKNIAAASFVLAEITLVVLVCLALRLPIHPKTIPEAYAVTVTLSLYLLGMGNLSSVYYPQRMNPDQSWTSSSRGRIQLLVLLVYPVLMLPVLLAYGARYAFDAEWAFYAVIAVGAAIGVILYRVAMDSALEGARSRREAFFETLMRSEGPVTS